MDKREKFIIKAKKRHGDKYDYSKVHYIDSLTPVCITCPEHGEFWQIPSGHLRGNECPKCANAKRGRIKRLDTETFIKRANEVHEGKYGYKNVKYVNAATAVNIICPIHGEFTQTPMQHLNGQGCPKCSGRGLNQDEVISLFKQVHGERYDYSKVEFTKMNTPVWIICPEHGGFWQTPTKHRQGQGCPVCGKRKTALNNRLSIEEFIKKSRLAHGDKYDYSKVDLNTVHDKVEIICPKHGSFYQYPYDHYNGHGCDKCGNINSKSEEDIYEYLCKILGKENVERHNRTILEDGREIDIYIPSKKIGIEYNGLHWHNEIMGKDRYYHVSKSNICERKGIRLIQIFEDEYLNHNEIVFSKICHIIGCDNNPMGKIMGRKTIVTEINMGIAREFLNKNHIQGYGNATLSLGCYYNKMLCGVMSFQKTGKENEWILSRFATAHNYICQGVGSKIFQYFIKKYSPVLVKSFADRRWTTNKDENLYTKMGFNLDSVSKPDYRYVFKQNPKERIHKFNLRKKTLHNKYGLPILMTESEMVKELGLCKIWDCGLYRYIWKKG